MDIIEKDINDQIVLTTYDNVEFYKPKFINLDKLNIFDNIQLYSDTSLSSYIKSEYIKSEWLT